MTQPFTIISFGGPASLPPRLFSGHMEPEQQSEYLCSIDEFPVGGTVRFDQIEMCDHGDSVVWTDHWALRTDDAWTLLLDKSSSPVH
jgi:hypothetical protein